MPDKFYGDLPKLREQWKRETLLGGRAPEELRWTPPAKRPKERATYTTPDLPLNRRFEGMWVVGSPGTGKTQFFKRQTKLDLHMVAAGKASMFVLDPTGDQPEAYDPDTGELTESSTLIHTITRLKRFAKGGDLYQKLVYINPEDGDYVVPINLFAMRAELDEDAIDSVIESYISIINGLLGQTLTPFQDTVIRNAIIATMAFSKPTLARLREVLAVHPPASARYTPPPPIYSQILHKLPPDVRNYFETTYESQRETRNAVLARLASLTTSAKFRRIFTSDKMPLNFNQLINEPKVIVINASREYLDSLKELYGRFFLSILKRAGELRPSGSIPCFAYIDEADEFIRDDQYAGDILFKLRRKRVGLIVGNQSTSKDQIYHDKTRRALFSTSMKLISVNEPDSAKELAEALNLRDGHNYAVDHFLGRKAFDFAYYCRGMTREPISYRFEPGILEAEPSMTEDEWKETYAEIRGRFYEPVERAPSYQQQVHTEEKELPLKPASDHRSVPERHTDASDADHRTEGSSNWEPPAVGH